MVKNRNMETENRKRSILNEKKTLTLAHRMLIFDHIFVRLKYANETFKNLSFLLFFFFSILFWLLSQFSLYDVVCSGAHCSFLHHLLSFFIIIIIMNRQHSIKLQQYLNLFEFAFLHTKPTLFLSSREFFICQVNDSTKLWCH
jgi:hypothetical protein